MDGDRQLIVQSLTLDWLHVVALLGAVQGFFLAGVLATQRRNRTANRILAVAIFAFSIHLTSVVYYAVSFEQVFPHFFGAAYPLPFLYGPLILLYALTASDRSRRLRRWDALHFVPFVVTVIVVLPIYLMSGAEKIALLRQLQQGQRPLLLTVIDWLKLVSGVAYSTATIVVLLLHRARVKDSYSSLERVNLRWLLQLAIAGAVIWALAATFQLTDQVANLPPGLGDNIVAVLIATLVYGIGYMALRQAEVFNFPAGSVAPSGSAVAPPPQPAVAAPDAAKAASPRYERSGLTEMEATSLKDALLALMESERPYQDSSLNLADLAGRLETTPHKLSEVLNSQLNQSFYDFVNGYRVREVQRRLADERSKHLTLLALALDAGFASKSTFNHVFKKHAGQTPSAYRRSLAG